MSTNAIDAYRNPAIPELKPIDPAFPLIHEIKEMQDLQERISTTDTVFAISLASATSVGVAFIITFLLEGPLWLWLPMIAVSAAGTVGLIASIKRTNRLRKRLDVIEGFDALTGKVKRAKPLLAEIAAFNHALAGQDQAALSPGDRGLIQERRKELMSRIDAFRETVLGLPEPESSPLLPAV